MAGPGPTVPVGARDAGVSDQAFRDVASATTGDVGGEEAHGRPVVQPLALGAAAAIVLSALLPWVSEAKATDVPLAFLLDVEALHDVFEGAFRLGILVALLGGFGILTILSARFARYRRTVGVAVVVVAFVFIVQFLRFGMDHNSDTSLGTAVKFLFTDDFGIGLWLALAGGITLWVTGREQVSANS